jgi:recombination protein RecA
MAKKTKRISTEFFKLDEMLGGDNPGIPVGKGIEIGGFPGSGKTTLALEISKQFEKPCLIDWEYETDDDFLKMLGVKNLEILRPETWEEGVDSFFHKILKNKKKQYDLVILDSVGAAMTKRELEADVGDNIVGHKAIKVAQWAKKANSIYKRLGITCIALNHRHKEIGAFGKDYTPGGRALNHLVSVKLMMSKAKGKLGENSLSSNIVQIRNKTKDGNEYGRCSYQIVRGEGLSRGFESLELGIECGLIKISGAWYHFGEEKFNGMKSIVEVLDQEEELRKVIIDEWKSKINNDK